MMRGSLPWPSLQHAKKAFVTGVLPQVLSLQLRRSFLMFALCTHQKHLHDHAKVEWKCLSAHMVDLIQSCLVVDAFARPPEWASEDLGDSCSGDAN